MAVLPWGYSTQAHIEEQRGAGVFPKELHRLELVIAELELSITPRRGRGGLGCNGHDVTFSRSLMPSQSHGSWLTWPSLWCLAWFD